LDSFSRAGRYKRLTDMWLLLSVVWLPYFVSMLTSDWLNMDGFLNPKDLYFTHGLWEMSGFNFGRHFLFETPFALLRGYTAFLWIPVVFFYVFFSIKSWLLYRKTLNQNN
jgi:hypothetical protein